MKESCWAAACREGCKGSWCLCFHPETLTNTAQLSTGHVAHYSKLNEGYFFHWKVVICSGSRRKRGSLGRGRTSNATKSLTRGHSLQHLPVSWGIGQTTLPHWRAGWICPLADVGGRETNKSLVLWQVYTGPNWCLDSGGISQECHTLMGITGAQWPYKHCLHTAPCLPAQADG